MLFTVQGQTCLEASDVLARALMTRQTLWPWRPEGKIPARCRHRGRQVLFSPEEVEVVDAYANRLEAVEPVGTHQLELFRSTAPTRNRRAR